MNRPTLLKQLNEYQIGYLLSKNNYERSKDPERKHNWKCNMHEYEQFIQTAEKLLQTTSEKVII